MLFTDSLTVSIDNVHPFNGDLLPYMLCHVNLVGKVFVKFFSRSIPSKWRGRTSILLSSFPSPS